MEQIVLYKGRVIREKKKKTSLQVYTGNYLCIKAYDQNDHQQSETKSVHPKPSGEVYHYWTDITCSDNYRKISYAEGFTLNRDA